MGCEGGRGEGGVTKGRILKAGVAVERVRGPQGVACWPFSKQGLKAIGSSSRWTSITKAESAME